MSLKETLEIKIVSGLPIHVDFYRKSPPHFLYFFPLKRITILIRFTILKCHYGRPVSRFNPRPGFGVGTVAVPTGPSDL